MTYQKLFHLKYKLGLTTYELFRRYPDEVGRVSEIALLEVPESILREIVKEEAVLVRLMRLKRRFAGLLRRIPAENLEAVAAELQRLSAKTPIFRNFS